MQKVIGALALAAVLLVAPAAHAAGINVVLNTDVNDRILAELGRYGRVRDVLTQLDAVTVQAKASDLAAIRALPFVAAANPDAERNGGPVDAVAAADFTNGISTWDLDAVNVTNIQAGPDRTVAYDGSGVTVAVLDSGLLDSWRQYFPQERIATQFGIAFGGGGGENGTVSSQPNKWQHDQNSHGTHVTSTILGYSLGGAAINGVAPKATIIPVKVLNQNGRGWSSVIARGIVYVADLKKSGQVTGPVVINMSLGGPVLDAVEKSAIDYAIANGVVVVASAGNNGAAGMGYPGAYEPVISVAASGWVGEWKAPAPGAPVNSWWNAGNVAEPTVAADFYITDFSSRALAGQELDVAAPGSWIVGPYQNQSGKTSYFFLGGTSMAAPHVAGVAARILQSTPGASPATVRNQIVNTATAGVPTGVPSGTARLLFRSSAQ
jgi:subtilisin family serine protease